MKHSWTVMRCPQLGVVLLAKHDRLRESSPGEPCRALIITISTITSPPWIIIIIVHPCIIGSDEHFPASGPVPSSATCKDGIPFHCSFSLPFLEAQLICIKA